MTGELDLFGEVRPPAPRRVGRRMHFPPASRALVESMAREGATVARIAKALGGVSESTVWHRFGEELKRGGARRRGRPTWSPSEEDRRRVVGLTADGATVERVSAALEVTEPTLRKHCAAELERGRAIRSANTERNRHG